MTGLACAVLLMVGAVDLSGVWQVSGRELKGEVALPGTLASAKLGTRWTEHDFAVTMDLAQSEALTEEYQYLGPASYVRTVDLSEADCRHPLEVYLERVMWKSEVFLDRVSLGVRDSLAVPHVHPIPPTLATPGRHQLKIVVDNSNVYNLSRQSHAYGPNMQAVWNGVLGQMEIRRSHPLRTARVFAEASGSLSVETEATVAAVSIDGLKVVSWRQDGNRLVINLGEKPTPWSDCRPRLYMLKLSAQDGFERAIRFGFRTLGVRGHHLTLNGREFFIRGNVENANFALDGTPWMDVDSWKRMLRTLRDEDGVNALRFHSWAPPAAAYEAADELGVLLQPEAGIWSDSWMCSGDELGNGKPVDAFVQRELMDIVDAYGNSPSFFSLSIGNELGNCNFSEMAKWIVRTKRHDPRHLYYCSSARTVTAEDDFALSHRVPEFGRARMRLFPRTDWDYEDAYSVSHVPTIAHEIGQWPVYPIWKDLLSPFAGTMRPWNLSRHFDTAKGKDALRFEREYHIASAKLNRLLYKEEVESFLRTPSCAGLDLLNVQDYTGQAEALVGWRDPFYRLKAGFGGLPKFTTVWGPVSYLARFEKFAWTVGETYRAELVVRNLTEDVLKTGTPLAYAIDGAVGEVRLSADIVPGQVGRVGTVSRKLDETMITKKHTLSFGSNSWNFWVYPQEEKCALPARVVETSDPETMKKAVRSGRTVLYTGRSSRCGQGQFKSVYWSARWFPVANTVTAALGTWFDATHPCFSGFVTEDFTDWQWYELVEKGLIHSLEGLPRDYRPIGLSVNDFHFSEFAATLFEAEVGTGRLFVCGYDIAADAPAAKRLRASIADYLAGPVARGTPKLDDAWLDRAFDFSEDKEVLSDAVFDLRPAWTGSAYKAELKGFVPVTGVVRIDCFVPEDGLTSGRGLLEGRVFEVPFAQSKGSKMSVSVPIDREDMLDGKLDLSVNLMTGKALGIERIRVFSR